MKWLCFVENRRDDPAGYSRHRGLLHASAGWLGCPGVHFIGVDSCYVRTLGEGRLLCTTRNQANNLDDGVDEGLENLYTLTVREALLTIITRKKCREILCHSMKIYVPKYSSPGPNLMLSLSDSILGP